MRLARGILVDGEDNVFIHVCGSGSYNVHVVDKDGKKQTVLLTTSEGLYGPYCITFRPSDNTTVYPKTLKTANVKCFG